jgi:chemotaxis regulatin CheY-phosphate phosphatase CheZ
LVNLVRLSRTAPGAIVAPEPTESVSRGFGPAIPGIDNGPAVSGQSDVDSLLAGLGM